jgi:hypothetical protein
LTLADSYQDGGQSPSGICVGHVTRVDGAPCLTVVSKDISHLQLRPGHGWLSGRMRPINVAERRYIAGVSPGVFVGVDQLRSHKCLVIKPAG